MKIVVPGSLKYQQLLLIEGFMRSRGISITGDNMRIHFKDTTYRIDNLGTQFPRDVEDMFIRVED